MLVGADHAAAQAAGERICSTASLLLGMPVRVTGRLECIESPRAGATAYAARDARTAELIDALRLALGPAPLVRESRKIEPPPSAPRRDVLPTIAGVTPSPASAPASAVTAPSTAEHAAAAKRVESRLIHAAASLGTPNTAGLKRLEAMLMLAANVPGLRPIVARCPYAEPIGLALDAAGGCHLLATADEATAAGVVTDMGRTRDWVRDHVELIRLTLPPGTALDAEADPEMHVFVREGRGVSRLLRQGVRVHVAMSATDEDALDVPRYIEIT